ncbi:MAG TPA: NnrS family protein [Noviherbaspirillum sp.]|uniref:NnrS family protein n=1 Tax=Noviherbaspirillum sp. TaxID=1926288 RepID=UPI002D5EE563|nr:NnrS family protein [Noviherbaspirillum sp.]HYD95815.1 NnrS family protein [Noviherbaspirillum sp.]
MTLLRIDEPQQAADNNTSFSHHPLFRLGFRPFYLLAAAFAAVSVPVWVARYYGMASFLTHVDLNWHMHEMTFGFALAVIIGFLFTAGRNWTGLWTPRRGHLAALAGLWLAGRIAMLAAPAWLAAIVDLLFLPLAAWPIYRVLQRTGNKRNMFLVGLLGLLTLVNACFHAAVLGLISASSVTPIHAAVLIIVMIESVIGGRVIPGFTANAVPGVKPVTDARQDKISLTLTALAALAWLAQLPAPFVASLAIAAACAQTMRLAGWKSHVTVRNPMLWILHLSYAWIPVGFFLLGLAAIDVVAATSAFHALAIGSMAGLIIGMITRTALGHTGRQLKAGRSEFAMYLLVQCGVLARLLAAAGVMRTPMLLAAAACWSAAFLLYVAVYAPYLMAPRVDGREG